MTSKAQKVRPGRHNGSQSVDASDYELLRYVLEENARGTDLHGRLRTQAYRLCRLGLLARCNPSDFFRLTSRGIQFAVRAQRGGA